MKTKRPSMATKINRDFYKSLIKRGRSHAEIMFMIQPQRRNQFYQDILPVLKIEPKVVSKLTLWQKIVKYFKGY